MPNEIESRRLEGLFQFVSECARLREYDPLLHLLAQRAHELIEFDRFTIFLYDNDRQVLKTTIIEHHVSREVSSDDTPLSEIGSIFEKLKTERDFGAAIRICTPLISAGCMTGLLCLTKRSGEYSSADVQLVQFLADCLAGTFERFAQARFLMDPSKDAISALKWHEESRRMAYLAQHDTLTSLPNRWLLNERLVWALASSRRYERRLAVLFLDLDHFKVINDSLGHGIGDQVLRRISDRLVRCVRSSDTVSRIGGDEFVILLTEIEDEKHAVICAEKIIATVAEPLRIASHELHPTVSIGIGMYPSDGADAETLIRNADTAMYHAKQNGNEKVQLFKPDLKVTPFEPQLVRATAGRR